MILTHNKYNQVPLTDCACTSYGTNTKQYVSNKHGDNRIHNLMGNISNMKCALHYKRPFGHIQRVMIKFSFYYDNEMTVLFLILPRVFASRICRCINAVNV